MDNALLDRALYALASQNVRLEDMRRRHDAFWGPLDGRRRVAAKVACNFFSTMAELNRQQYIFAHSDDETERKRAHRLSLELASCALSLFNRFGELVSAADRAETIRKLNRLIDYAKSKDWTITPPWWHKSPIKDTSYFVSRLEVFVQMRDSLLGEIRRQVEKRNSKRKGGAK